MEAAKRDPGAGRRRSADPGGRAENSGQGKGRRAGAARAGTRRVESRGRARALQAVYAWDVRSGPPVGLEGTAGPQLVRTGEQVWEDLAVAPDERRQARRLVRALSERMPLLDRELEVVATNWRLERMSVVDRCVLRLAAAELAALDTPPRVVIQEAVRLAERYGSSQSAHFVNGVLDALARRTGRL